GNFNNDNRSLGGNVEYTYALAPRIGVGANVVGRYRDFQDRFQVIRDAVDSNDEPVFGGTFFVPGTTTGILNSNLIIFSDLTPTFKFRVSGGPSGVILRQPSYSLTDVEPPPGRQWTVTETRSEELTYFASASLTKHLSRGRVSADWIRNEDASSGVGSSTLLNQVSMSGVWNTDQYWRWRGLVGWRNRKQEREPFAGSTLPTLQREFTEVWLDTSFIRTINERVDIRFRFRYEHRLEAFVDGADRPETSRFIGAVTIRYEFEPYRL
ncbi:MAG: hypothetical protein JRG92_17095, partial [Deltaproteobacteria bacterium]|nr:hypothetical protein [Deltaproteobacteria bacterium]